MNIESTRRLGCDVIFAIALIVLPGAALMLSVSPAFAEDLSYRAQKIENCDRLYHETGQISSVDAALNPEWAASKRSNILRQMDEWKCDELDQRSSPSSSSAVYVEPTPPPVALTRFPNFDPMKPESQQVMLICAATYGFFTDVSAQTNPLDKAAYEAMLTAFQNSKGISRQEAEDLVTEKRWSIGSSMDFSKIDKSRGIEFTLAEFRTIEDEADTAFMCGNTLGINQPSLVATYLPASRRQ